MRCVICYHSFTREDTEVVRIQHDRVMTYVPQLGIVIPLQQQGSDYQYAHHECLAENADILEELFGTPAVFRDAGDVSECSMCEAEHRRGDNVTVVCDGFLDGGDTFREREPVNGESAELYLCEACGVQLVMDTDSRMELIAEVQESREEEDEWGEEGEETGGGIV